MSDEKRYPHLAAARKRLQELLALGKEKKAEIEATYSEPRKEEKKQEQMSLETKASGAPCPPPQASPPQKKARRSRSKKAPPAPPKSSHGKQSCDERSSGSSSRSSSSSSSSSSSAPRKHRRSGEGSGGRSRGRSHHSKKQKKETPPLPVVDNTLKTSVPTPDAPVPSPGDSRATKEADIDALVKKRVDEEMARVHADVKQTVRQAQQQISLSKILAI